MDKLYASYKKPRGVAAAPSSRRVVVGVLGKRLTTASGRPCERAAVRKNQRSARGCRGRVSPLSSRQGLIRARPAPLRDEEEGVHQNEVKLLVWSMCPHVFYSVAELVCCGTHHWTPFSWCGWSGGRAIGGGKATYRAGIGTPKWRPNGDVAENKRSACLSQ